MNNPYKVVVSNFLWTVDGPEVFEPSPNEYVAGRVQLVANAAFAAGQRAADKELVKALIALYSVVVIQNGNRHADINAMLADAHAVIAKHREGA